MPTPLKLCIAGVVALSAFALVAATLLYEPHLSIAPLMAKGTPPSETDILLGVAFWTVLTLLGSAFPVQLPRGTQQAVAIAPILGSVFLGGPAVGAWVAAIGTTEVRELRGDVPWYGTLANHAVLVLSAVVAGVIREFLVEPTSEPAFEFMAAMLAAAAFMLLNLALVSTFLALRTGQVAREVFVGDLRGIAGSVIALAPLAWLMAVIYTVQWWGTALFAVPLYSTRLAYQRFVEMRDMFTQTIGALAEAVDKRDPYTARHSQRVKEIAVDDRTGPACH